MSQAQQAQKATPIVPAWAYPPPLNPSTMMVGTFETSVSDTGTIEIPTCFVAVLQIASPTEIGLYLNRYDNCIDGCGIDFAPFVILNDPIRVPINNGSITLPSDWVLSIGLTDRAFIVGKGRTFQIWEPKSFEGAINAVMKRQFIT